MAVATTIVIIITLIIGLIFLILVIMEFKNFRKPIVTGKPVYNYLSRFTDGHIIGSFIKKVPVGKNKDLYRVHFTIKETDEHGNKKIIEKKIVVKKNYLKETPNLIKILPKDITELNHEDENITNLSKFIREQNGIDLIAEATRKDKAKFNERFIEGYGGELSEFEIGERLKLKETEEKEPEEKNKKKD